MNVPGSPSAALTTTGVGCVGERVRRDRAPLQARGEAGTAAAAQAGIGEQVDEDVGRHRPCRRERRTGAGGSDSPESVSDGSSGDAVQDRTGGDGRMFAHHPIVFPIATGRRYRSGWNWT